MDLVWDAGFKRSYKKRIAPDPNLKKRFWDAVEQFTGDPFATPLKTHRLTGKLSGYWAFSVDEDCRVLFLFIKGNKKALLLDIGSHDEVY
ncbi:MAG: type II toxin-antitoxin system mRNA interferase toxin, RelE/StbE family [Flavobacteriales bacterium]|nr:type II toxin-antitoxin system mRNA interferase toxin, RelE/StbE family [Flavobacteriales bacterium]